MTRALNKLSAARAKALRDPGRHSDGAGLYLRIRPSGAKSWIFNYSDNGRRRDLGLGGYSDVTLAQARDRARACRSAMAEGCRPSSALVSRRNVTFEEASRRYIAMRSSDWRSAKTHYKWNMFLERYGKPLMPLACKDIRREDVEAALRPHWIRINHSARYFRSMVESILDYAAVKGWREGDNPARWKGNLEHVLARKKPPTRHNTAVPFDEAPELYSSLLASTRSGPRCAAFVMLTAARNGEARLASRDQIDWDTKVWTIPGEMMKRGREHSVPLSTQAIDLLQAQPVYGWTNLFFPGLRQKPLSDATVRMAIRRVGFSEATAHGLRSTFRDWCGETGVSRELAELALSHAVGNETERAYRRMTALERRRELMQQWADYLANETGSHSHRACINRFEFQDPTHSRNEMSYHNG